MNARLVFVPVCLQMSDLYCSLLALSSVCTRARQQLNYSDFIFSSVYLTLEADATTQVEEPRRAGRWAEPRHHFPSLSGLHCRLVDRVALHLEASLLFLFIFIVFFYLPLFFTFFFFFFLPLHRAACLHDVSFLPHMTWHLHNGDNMMQSLGVRRATNSASVQTCVIVSSPCAL